MTNAPGGEGSRPKVVVSELIHPAALGLLEEHAEVHYDPELHTAPDALREAVARADALIVRNRTAVTAHLVSGSALRVVGRLGVGLDNLEVESLQRAGMTITWAPGTNATSVAEYVVGAAIALARKFTQASAAVNAGQWDRQAAVGSELQGKTFGLIGLGDIGARVARRAAALGMRTMAVDPALEEHSAAVQEHGVELVELDELLRESQVVSLHVPLTSATRGLIDEERLGLMKRGAYLINTARGGLVDERALAAALREGRLAGAALDVREHEPPGADDPLAGIPNLILTPHVAGVTEESNERACLHVARDVLRVLAGERPRSQVPVR